MDIDFDYSYSATRLHLLRSSLLRREDYLAMMGSGSLKELIAMLEHTGYRDCLSGIKNHSLAEFEGAVLSDLSKTYNTLISWTPESAKPLFGAMRYRLFVENIKSVLSSIAMGEAVAESRLFPLFEVRIGGTSESPSVAEDLILRQIIEAGSVDEAVSVLKKEIDLSHGLALFKETGSIAAMLIELDREYYARIWDILNPRFSISTLLSFTNLSEIKDLIGTEMDLLNVMNILKARTFGYDPGPLLLPNYKIDKLEKIAGIKDPNDIFKYLGELGYLRFFKDVADLDALEKTIRSYLGSRYEALLRSPDIGINQIVGYLRVKESEVMKLISVATAIEYELEEPVKRELLGV